MENNEGVDIMATSTFYKTIVIDDKAADIIIKGLNSPKFPRPEVDIDGALERGQELLRQLRSNSKTLSIPQMK